VSELTASVLARATAGAVTAIAAFLVSIPITDRLTLIGLTADAAALFGWPALLAADAMARRWGGAA
jgi:uncharacterized PurR-regulated membrane protein YhhQ (DUF165 family)